MDHDPDTVQRYVITHIRDGLRRLTFAMQGRETYATKEEAEAVLKTFNGPEGLERVLTTPELESLQVRECPCWAGHFDPVGCYFPEEP